jgi:hypothetical protein
VGLSLAEATRECPISRDTTVRELSSVLWIIYSLVSVKFNGLHDFLE